ncbi:MAG: flagellar basal body P-ring formation protein FlgA [Planctomycetes bacterium]|nr:flagellar basal body P-ring formation protein FlgA [Planctomycetota bacterium]
MQAIAMLLCGLFAVAPVGGDEKHDPTTALKLKPTVWVRGMNVTIGELCELPADASGMALAQIRFGPAPVNGYARTISRTEIVQSLAGAGIDLKSVRFEGADEVIVQARVEDVPAQEMLDAATTALQAQLALEGGDVEFEPPQRMRTVQAPPGRQSQELKARVRGAKTGPNAAIVDVEIQVDGEQFRKIPVTFTLRRFQQVLKTTGPIRAGQPLGPDVVGLVREQMDQATSVFLARIDQVDGMIASRNLQSNQRLTLGDIAPPAVVRKGDVVTVVLTRGRVKVTAKAIANHDAPLNGRVALTNLQSRATLAGFVYGPGLVVVQQ